MPAAVSAATTMEAAATAVKSTATESAAAKSAAAEPAAAPSATAPAATAPDRRRPNRIQSRDNSAPSNRRNKDIHNIDNNKTVKCRGKSKDQPGRHNDRSPDTRIGLGREPDDNRDMAANSATAGVTILLSIFDLPGVYAAHKLPKWGEPLPQAGQSGFRKRR